jgi:chorismate lyase/3-hydroxybenzoate synthase
VDYLSLPEHAPLPDGLLAAVSFGVKARPDLASGNTLGIQVRLDPLLSPASRVPTELWWAHGPVSGGQAGAVRYAHDAHHLFAVIELDEREHGGIEKTAALAYSSMRQFQQQSAFPHLLRVWNYMDAINQGSGDLERYRHFCVGRADGMEHAVADKYPAATAIGQQRLTHLLQVYWLAGRLPGTQIENPRQISAYRYPRAHGPVSPSFARATFSPDGTLLISGTASIVGHASRHDDDFVAQLDETVRNLSTLKNYADTAASAHSSIAVTPANARGLFKVYVRDGAHAAQIAELLRQHPPQHFDPGNVIYLAADICRRELLLEIECLRIPAGA